MEKKRIIIAGSRGYNNYDQFASLVIETLAEWDVTQANQLTIISGMAQGTDKMGERFAKDNQVECEGYPAQWNVYGRSAGYKRNVQMANVATHLIAFRWNMSPGTTHMINIAKEKGLTIKVFDSGDQPQSPKQDKNLPKYIQGEYWDIYKQYDLAAITTNGTIKRNGHGVMGAGIAKQAKLRYEGLEATLGLRLKKFGNTINGLVQDGKAHLISFPVKDYWHKDASLELIRQSCKDLIRLLNNRKDFNTALLNFPGIGNGKLKYEDVKPILDECLDARVTIITK